MKLGLQCPAPGLNRWDFHDKISANSGNASISRAARSRWPLCQNLSWIAEVPGLRAEPMDRKVSEALPYASRYSILASAFFAEQESKKKFIPGQTYIPCSGKVLDASDLRHLLDASLDMWLTAGRYATKFETALASRFGLQSRPADCVRFCGQSARILGFDLLETARAPHRTGQ